MKIDLLMTDDSILKLMGERIMRIRLNKNLSQASLAEEAGLGLRTIQRMELGETSTRLSSFLRVCRVLGLIEALNILIPEQPASPIEMMKLEGRARKRASTRKSKQPTTAPWSWGDSK